MPPIITIENLGKRYTLRHQGGGPRYRRLSEELAAALARPFRSLFPISASPRLRVSASPSPPSPLPAPCSNSEEFWALRNISFDVQEGEVLGIIGRNGAGKSTLLKVLSRITEPTEGRVRIRGRVASLLEVGTGFHPELTGRENIFLNGAILGMSRAEIRKKFDEIVAFAEVEKFLDTPVKHYSSGMYVRLAFAVAAHLEPEILVVDEVLAVGDVEFQKKCLGKMSEVARGGRTVLFVSHNLAAVQGLCSRCVRLVNGQCADDGLPGAVVQRYLATLETPTDDPRSLWQWRQHGRSIRIESVSLLIDGKHGTHVVSGSDVTIVIRYTASDSESLGRRLGVSLLLYDANQRIANLWTNYHRDGGIVIDASGLVECRIPRWPFRNQRFDVELFTHVGAEPQEWIEHALRFSSSDGDYYRSGVITNPDQGIVFVDHEWRSSVNGSNGRERN
ncbi:MAG: ABC transporter ATP-binding protein [Thermoguttaceae bacterium]